MTKQKGDKRKSCREKEFLEKAGNRSHENEVPKEKDSQLTDVLTNIVWARVVFIFPPKFHI